MDLSELSAGALEIRVRREFVKVEDLGLTWTFCMIVKIYLYAHQALIVFLSQTSELAGMMSYSDKVMREIAMQMIPYRQLVYRWVRTWDERLNAGEMARSIAMLTVFHQHHLLSHLGNLYSLATGSMRAFTIMSFLDCVGEVLFTRHTQAFAAIFATGDGPSSQLMVQAEYLLWCSTVIEISLEHSKFDETVNKISAHIIVNQALSHSRICSNPAHVRFDNARPDECACLRNKIFNNLRWWVFLYTHLTLTGSFVASSAWFTPCNVSFTVRDARDGMFSCSRFSVTDAINHVIPILNSYPCWAKPSITLGRVVNNEFVRAVHTIMGETQITIQIRPYFPPLLTTSQSMFFRMTNGPAGRDIYFSIRKPSKIVGKAFVRAFFRRPPPVKTNGASVEPDLGASASGVRDSGDSRRESEAGRSARRRRR